jgi:hypothetical protein
VGGTLIYETESQNARTDEEEPCGVAERIRNAIAHVHVTTLVRVRMYVGHRCYVEPHMLNTL